MSSGAAFLDAEAIRAATFVRHVELHDSLPSTNDRALELAALPDLETPALVAARLQTAGRGRGANQWWSGEGALTFSLILDTATWGITQRDWPRLSLTTAVALCDAIAPLSPCSIKWPNDVLIGDRKVAGILLESPVGRPPTRDRLVIGVGINVNNSWRDAPGNDGSVGIALCDATAARHPLDNVLVDFLQAFGQRLHQLTGNDPALAQAWQRSSWLTGQEVVIDTGKCQLAGKCLGITDDAALIVDSGAKSELVWSGTVQACTRQVPPAE